jgi:hypothetical protein
MPMPRPRPRFRCRFCGITFSAGPGLNLPGAGEPDSATLLHHMSQAHPAELRPYLDQMHTTRDITPAILQAFEAVEEPPTHTRGS